MMRRKSWLHRARVVVGLLATGSVGTLAALQGWDWLHRPKGELEAHVHYSRFSVPPHLRDGVSDFGEQLTMEGLLRAAQRAAQETGELKSRLARRTAYDIAMHLRDQWREASWGLRLEIEEPRGYIEIQLRNPGDDTIEDVSVILPLAARHVWDVRSAGSRKLGLAEEVIELGRLAPEETTTVIVWADGFAAKHTAKQVKVRHRSGIGKVRVYEPTTGIFLWMYKTGPVGLAVHALLIAYLLLGVVVPVGRYVVGRTRAAAVNETASPEETDSPGAE